MNGNLNFLIPRCWRDSRAANAKAEEEHDVISSLKLISFRTIFERKPLDFRIEVFMEHPKHQKKESPISTSKPSFHHRHHVLARGDLTCIPQPLLQAQGD